VSKPELIYGIHAVQAALDGSGTVTELWLATERKDRRLEAIRQRAIRDHIHINETSRKSLNAMTDGARHQGVAAHYMGTAPLDLDYILETIGDNPFLLVLDGVQDPHNLGACLRSAEAAGVHAVIVPKDRAVGLTAVVHTAASGAAERLPFVQVTNLARTLKHLKDRGIWITGANMTGEISIYEVDLTGPLALVLGAEGEGLRRLTREACDHVARIPMAGNAGSLNVSVAAGICLFEAVRQRRA